MTIIRASNGRHDDVPFNPTRSKQQVAAHWGRRAAHFDEDFGHSIRTAAERAAWDRIFDLVLGGRSSAQMCSMRVAVPGF